MNFIGTIDYNLIFFTYFYFNYRYKKNIKNEQKTHSTASNDFRSVMKEKELWTNIYILLCISIGDVI